MEEGAIRKAPKSNEGFSGQRVTLLQYYRIKDQRLTCDNLLGVLGAGAGAGARHNFRMWRLVLPHHTQPLLVTPPNPILHHLAVWGPNTPIPQHPKMPRRRWLTCHPWELGKSLFSIPRFAMGLLGMDHRHIIFPILVGS